MFQAHNTFESFIDPDPENAFVAMTYPEYSGFIGLQNIAARLYKTFELVFCNKSFGFVICNEVQAIIGTRQIMSRLVPHSNGLPDAIESRYFFCARGSE